MVAAVSLDPCLRRLMAQTIYVAAQSSTLGTHGDRTWGSPTSAPARVEPNRRTFYGANGEGVTPDFAVFTTQRVGLSDRVWLPGENSASAAASRQPHRVFVGVDTDGTPSHYEVYV